MVAVAYVAPSPKALADRSTRDRVIIHEFDPSHPATPEMPDGGEIFIAANPDAMPTLAALTQEVQAKIGAGLLVQMSESDAMTRRRDVYAGKLTARQQQARLAAQDRPLEDQELRAELDARATVEAPDNAEIQATPTDSGDRATVAVLTDQIRGVTDADALDAIETREANYPGGPRKGVTDAIARQRQTIAGSQSVSNLTPPVTQTPPPTSTTASSAPASTTPPTTTGA